MKWDIIAKAKKTLTHEQGHILKNWGGHLPIALAYANSYQVGMSSLGFQTLYRLWNEQPQVVCERIFWSEGARDPLITLESQHDVLDCAVWAFSLSFELDYFNLVTMLQRAEMPLRAAERDETYPLVLVGGPAVTANPEPLASIADAFFIGEAEEQIAALSQLLWELLDAPRRELLDALAQFPGVYVPERSTLPVKRQVLRDLDAYPTTTAVFTPDTEFGDMFLMEISRGCGRGCRFCLAGYTYRPPRERSLPTLLAQAREGLRYRQRVGLVGAAISDYSRIDDLVGELRALDCKISVSSLRIKPLSERLVAALVESGTRTLTLAPEAGSERLRACINKGIAEDDILAAAELAQRYHFPALKLYFMVGLPGETRDDIVALLALVQRIGQRYAGALSVNVSPFVPKAHTPFQWAAMAAPEVLEEHLALLREGLRKLAVEFKAEGVPWSRVQGVLSRGDQRLGDVLVDLPARVNPRLWQRALESHELSEDEYLRARGPDEPLPWGVVDVGVSQNYLRAESNRAASAAAPCAACQENAR